MKVMFLFQGLPHYYNYVLNRLNAAAELEIINVVPSNPVNIGEGVFQSQQDIEYKLHTLEEYQPRYGGFFFKSLWRVILKERPDIIVTGPAFFNGFIHNPPTMLVMRLLRVRLILKNIPFRFPKYQELQRDLDDELKKTLGRPSLRLSKLTLHWPLSKGPLSAIFKKVDIGLANFMKRRRRMATLRNNRLLCNIPDAHVCYIDEAFDIYGSYGVPRDKIFITYNSPDTDRLFAVRNRLLEKQNDKSAHKHRLIHVGRLVTWKRVDLLLIVLAELKKKYDDVDLLVIGDGPQGTEWKSLAVSLGIQNDVRFVGGIYDPIQLGDYLMSSSIYVLAGMGGLSINEAMCFGLPIICSVCDGTEKYLVKDGINGLFFREGDAGDLHKKIDYLFDRPDLLAQMGRNSLEIIRNEINISTVIRGYIQAFEHVTGRRIGSRSS